jgi:SAM-dependent methyltransferase
MNELTGWREGSSVRLKNGRKRLKDGRKRLKKSRRRLKRSGKRLIRGSKSLALTRMSSIAPSNTDLHLPQGYVRRPEPAYFDDPDVADAAGTLQPEVYDFTRALAKRLGASTIVDIGCGNGRRIAAFSDEFKTVGVDVRANITACRDRWPELTWMEADLEAPGSLFAIPQGERVVVVCSDVLEHQSDPRILLAKLRDWRPFVEALVISSPDRIRSNGSAHTGPPGDMARTMEWTRAELGLLLRAWGLESALHGFTRDSSERDSRATQVALIPGGSWMSSFAPTSDETLPTVRAIMPVYNEVDVVLGIVGRLLAEGVDVHIVDNWSTDGSWESLVASFDGFPGFTHERFPATGPVDEYQWREILSRMDVVAAESPHDWIVHVDADEIIESCFPGQSLRESIGIVDRGGFDAIDLTALIFRPVNATGVVERGTDPSSMMFWEFGDRPGHQTLVRLWKNRNAPVNIADSGGHSLGVPHRLYPMSFMLRHYPLRSEAQAREKAFGERRQRSEKERLAQGWHVQYEHLATDEEIVWQPSDLHRWTNEVPVDWVIETATRCGLKFGEPS